MKELVGKSISELRSLLDSKEVKAKEIAEAHIAHAKRFDDELGTYNVITQELALQQADSADKKIAAGEASALTGIPIALKDNMVMQGYPTTCSSKILANFIPPYQGTVARKLDEVSAVVIGKTNMDEFAMGSSNENSSTRPCRNPWNKQMVPGGSSGGSAAAVASGSVVVSLGSDTGGSIRQPASFCGVVGMKPTYGTVSRFGLVAFASSLDQIGPIARSVKDAAFMLDAIAGHDPSDSTSYSEQLPSFAKELETPLKKGVKLGLIKELVGEGIDEDVKKAILAAVETYKKLGFEVEEISMPQLKHALPVYYIICTAEASANLARFDGVRYGLRAQDAKDLLTMYNKTRQQGFGAEVKRRIMLGTYALSSGYYDAYYKKAQQVRRLIKEEFDKQFGKFDLLISPTSPSVAFQIGAKVDDPLTMYLSDIATIPANLAGIPGISLPCGFGDNNLPIGLQLLGPALADAKLLQAAHAFEQATDFNKERPAQFFLDKAGSHS